MTDATVGSMRPTRPHRAPTRHKTKTGSVMTDVDIEAMADEAERDYDVETLKTRRRGRPMPGSPSGSIPI